MSNKIDFPPKVTKRDGKEHFILIKGKNYEDDFSTLNIYIPNAREPTIENETILKLKSHTLIVGDFHTLFSPTDGSL